MMEAETLPKSPQLEMEGNPEPIAAHTAAAAVLPLTKEAIEKFLRYACTCHALVFFQLVLGFVAILVCRKFKNIKKGKQK